MISAVNNPNSRLHLNCTPFAGIIRRLNQRISMAEIHSKRVAQLLANLIPASCPFERDIHLFGRTLFHIPPLCKLNPLFESLMVLRFRALTFLNEH